MQTATQLANLRPFVPNDPRIKAGPGRPPGIRKKIQRFLDAPGGTVNGEQLTMEERGILETMIKMTGGVAGKPVSEMAQLRAFDLIMCRRYGKPEQPIKQSGSLDLHHTFIGRRLADIPDEELPAIERALIEKRLLLRGNEVIINAEFVEMADSVPKENSENGESESEAAINA